MILPSYMANNNTMIIADDDPEDTLFLVDALNETGQQIELITISHGEQLLSTLANAPKPLAVFIDLYLLGKNGKQCLKEIREQSKFNDVQIIMLAGSYMESDANYCLSNGANYFIRKPNSYNDLVNIVESLCTEILVK
jgi:DNA-binding response OmpR family regulator